MPKNPPSTLIQDQDEAGIAPKNQLNLPTYACDDGSALPVEASKSGERPARRNMTAKEFLVRHKFQDFDEASEAIGGLQQRTKELVSAGLDNITNNRLTPAYDEAIKRENVALNKKISGLAGALMQGMSRTTHKNWTQNSNDIFWDCHNLSSYEKVTKLTLKRLLIQAMWKYFVIQVFNDPFATFEVKEGEEQLIRGLRDIYKSLHSEVREKWRFLFIQDLGRTARNHNSTIEKAFTVWLKDTLMFPDSSIEKSKPKITSVVNAVLDFARMLALQQAHFTFTEPSSYDGEEDCTTHDGTSVGINGDHGHDETRTPVGILTTPALLKWGDGSGLNPEECSVLQKAFVGMAFLEDEVS